MSTQQILTKYEKASILGKRAINISNNAPVMVDTNGQTDPMRIARMELNNKKLNMTIKRTYPNGTFKLFNVQDMILPDE